MKSRISSLLFFLFILTTASLKAQVSISDSAIGFGMINMEYYASAPGGDLKDRFGFTNTMGASIGWKWPSNFYVLGSWQGLFGNQVKDSVGWNVMTMLYNVERNAYNGLIPGTDGKLTEVRFYERGYVIPLVVGKIFPISPANPNSGLYVEAGTQFIQHKIHLEAIGQDAPAVAKPYNKGYDRLTNGLGLVEGFGFRYFSRNRLVNFHLGMQFSQNFTKSRRSVNLDSGQTEFPNRLDLLYGFKLGWTFLIYNQAADKEYYY
ncbi:MAG: hypothetical protein H6581_07190 [Bacteroidia bacterium]|nr:hypothetical protein [Bacteroidia bacterium]